MRIASLSDSQFIKRISFLIAILSSSAVFPTPEKTIFFGFIPAFKAFNNSPPETTSAPAPSLPKILKIVKKTGGFFRISMIPVSQSQSEPEPEPPARARASCQDPWNS